MSASGLRLLLALILSVLAAGGRGESVSPAPSAHAAAIRSAEPARASASRAGPVSRALDPFVLPPGAWHKPTASGTPPLGRSVVREGGGPVPALRAHLRPALAPGQGRVLLDGVRPVFARRLAAARDGTLSSRSTGVPPPLS